jgi:hypothetical protein
VTSLKDNAPPKSQADKFRDLARELGCDEDEAKFDEALKRIAKSPPQHREKPKPE